MLPYGFANGIGGKTLYAMNQFGGIPRIPPNSGDTILNFRDSFFSFETSLGQVSVYEVFSPGYFQAGLKNC